MVDDRLDILLHALEQAPEPEPLFAEQLYRDLAAKAGFGTRGSAWRAQIQRARWVVGPLRLAWLLLLVLLIILAMLAFFGAGGPSPRPYTGISSVAPSATPATLTSPTLVTTSSTPTLLAGSTPRGSFVPMERPTSGVLTIGQPAPDWSASLLDGGSLNSADMTGRPAAVYLWCGCVPGPEARAFAAEAAARADQMTLLLASLDSPGTTRGLVDWLGFDGPVIADGNPLLKAWDLSYFPALVLFRADGTVADLQPADFSPEQLSKILDALIDGGRIPDPEPRLVPPTDAAGRPLLSSVLAVGQAPPELSGPGLGGVERSTLELIGRPSVVLHWVPPDAAGHPRDDAPAADELIAALDERAAGVNGMLVANGEQSTGDVAAYLEARGTTLPLIFDWSGELFDRWGLVYWPTVVALDAEGRVVALGDSGAVANPIPFMDALLTPGASQAIPGSTPTEEASP